MTAKNEARREVFIRQTSSRHQESGAADHRHDINVVTVGGKGAGNAAAVPLSSCEL
jgi:hypothetical protein